MRLWFDDVRPPPTTEWAWARTVPHAKYLLMLAEREHTPVEECSLDHDMGLHEAEIPDDPDELLALLESIGRPEETGLDLVDWMIENDLVPAKITIHSWNPAGSVRMARRFNDNGYDCLIEPFKVEL